MKILSFSDLHVDFNNNQLQQNIIDDLAEYVQEVAPDRVLVAGDMAGGAENCIRYIEEIERKSGVPLSYIPGNHSIWTNKKEVDSWTEYERLKQHHSSLIDRPLLIGTDWVLLGDMGWYDYTLDDKGQTRESIVKQKNRVWKDSVMARFGMEDEELFAHLMDKFKSLLEIYREKNVIFVNHFIPYDDFVPPSKDNNIWNLIRPFMGSKQLGELLDQYANVRYVIFGHIHIRYGTKQKNGKQIICNPLGYTKEWRTTDVATEIRSSSTLIEINESFS